MALAGKKDDFQLSTYERLPFLIALGATLVVWLPFQDPINIPKLAVITLGTFLVLPLLKSAFSREFTVVLVLLGTFAAVLVVLSILDNDVYRSVIGAYGRKTGSLIYICMAIIFAISMRYTKIREQNLLFYILAGSGSVLGIYGYLQYLDLDPINWVNPFSTIVLTLGNPNFASAFLAISASAALWLGFRNQQAIGPTSMYLAITIVLTCLVYLSDSQQGFLILAVNIAILGLVKLSGKAKRWQGLYLATVTVVGAFGLFGMLQKGPLATWLYQPSISFRGDYWRAAINMFSENLLFGVGLDNYGENYTKYRDVTQVVNSGPETIADSAHNVFLQMAATGGVPLFASYLLIQIYVFWQGIKILKTNAAEKSNYLGCAIFAMWLGFQAQSFISVENLGIITFGWILGGAVCGISLNKNIAQSSSRTKNDRRSKVQIATKVLLGTLSFALIVSWFIFSIRITTADAQLQKAKYLVINETSDQEAAAKAGMLVDTLRKNPSEKTYTTQVAVELVKLRYIEEAKKRLSEAFPNGAYSRKALYILGEISIVENDVENLIKIRKAIAEIDSFNYVNNFALVQLLVDRGNQSEAKAIFEKTKRYAIQFPEYEQALRAIETLNISD
jgi:O-antigen ligase/TolA-binding protein